MPLNKSIQKALVIGSGPIVIGQAAEFDYAGAQACRVLKKAGVNVVLVNSNPATIMTDKALADEIYLEPLTLDTVKRIIEKERPDSLLAGLGGQTGLTLAMQLSKEGFLDRMGVRLLGTGAEAIDKAEDRKLFKETMDAIGQPTVPSDIANDVETALAIAERIGYPIIIRPAFTLGGFGGGVANDPGELETVAAGGLEASPIHQVLVEKYIFGWKEIEFETMRDGVGNVIAVCSMENFDPVGVHTGDSIVAAPALTLSNKEYQMLRTASLDIVSALGIVGGCNCQFALNPDSFEYAVIEVNPRVSRSSALASKATGYPIAKVTTQIALGYTLDEIKNDITGKTCACFEPSVDYVVVKVPKWPFDKFAGSSRKLGTAMKATGEVMAIGPSFENALMKAVRGCEIKLDTLNRTDDSGVPVLERLQVADDHRLFNIFEAIKTGVSLEDIHQITRIDPWFLSKIKKLADFEAGLARNGLTAEAYGKGKQLGYPDEALLRLSGASALPCAPQKAVYKMVDTCGGEFDAETPYFYASYGEECEARPFVAQEGKPTVLVLGSGPIRIGQGIEFDYSSVHCVWTLKELGYSVAIINNNPETVSTDYDTADRLYFEPLCPEDVMNVIDVEKPVGVVVAFGGQTAIKLTQFLGRQGIPILGTSADGIDMAEDRERFDALLEKFGIRRPRGRGVRSLAEALEAANELGYPVLLRPSYVIGGQNMTIAHEDADVEKYMNIILSGRIENPVLVDKYMQGPELEVDVISDGRDVLIPGVMEHIERAGVHSGDSIAVYPPYNLSDAMLRTIIDCSEKLALSLGTRGLVNIQYLIYQNELYVIEVNPRASRTVPYISKVTGVPMVDLASRVMLGASLKDLGYGTGLYSVPPYCAVKVPVFSFEKLNDVNSNLGPEMKSTGEVLGLGKTMNEALFKGLTAAGIRIKTPQWDGEVGVFISVDMREAGNLVVLAKKLDDMGLRLYATRDTADVISSLGIAVTYVDGLDQSDQALRLLESGKFSYIVYTGAMMDSTMAEYTNLHRHALQQNVACLTSLDTANALADIIASRFHEYNTELVDINHLRRRRQTLRFTKMNCAGNDLICVENFHGEITCPESLCISLCDRHFGVGGDGIMLLEDSDKADCRVRLFNTDGSEALNPGTGLLCAAKYLYDSGMLPREIMRMETAGGIRQVELYIRNHQVSSGCVRLEAPSLDPRDLPLRGGGQAVDRSIFLDGREYRITCVSLGNPHCVVFLDKIDAIDLQKVGPLFERASIFTRRVNTELVRVVNSRTLKMRTYERGSGETLACSTGACAAVAAAVANGYCRKGEDITVKMPGGDMTVCLREDGLALTAAVGSNFSGSIEY